MIMQRIEVQWMQNVSEPGLHHSKATFTHVLSPAIGIRHSIAIEIWKGRMGMYSKIANDRDSITHDEMGQDKIVRVNGKTMLSFAIQQQSVIFKMLQVAFEICTSWCYLLKCCIHKVNMLPVRKCTCV
jgi:hypothetical protein